jgi:hypothetical protein
MDHPPHASLPQYLAIGHVSRDIVTEQPLTWTAGGTVTFSGRAALALGYRTGVVTSASADFDIPAALPGCAVACRPAPHTTTFTNQYTPQGRVQTVHATAAPLRAADVPPSWRAAPLVHLGPIIDAVEPDIIDLFPNALVGLTPQGWMRTTNPQGHVQPVPMRHGEWLLPRAHAVIISQEDYADEAELRWMRKLSRLLVLTKGYNGCVVFQDQTILTIPAPRVVEVNPTGAGDIFAAAFLVHLWQTGQVGKSAEFATRIAADSVTRANPEAKMAAIQTLFAFEQPFSTE